MLEFYVRRKIKAIFIPSEPVINRMILNAHKIQFIILLIMRGKLKEIEKISLEKILNFLIMKLINIDFQGGKKYVVKRDGIHNKNS